MLVIGIAMAATMWSNPQVTVSAVLRLTVSISFLLAAGMFGPRAILTFSRVKTTIDPVRIDRANVLVTTGVYRFTRNPMYLSMALLLTAWASYLAHPLAAIGPIAFVMYISRFQIFPEERVLQAKFGDLYTIYRSEVRRWI
jgi:protein-S-isoprenylcysteine O-methyltransferase Ste14